MYRLYKITANQSYYWEAWFNETNEAMFHWGKVGTLGQTRLEHGSADESIDEVVNKGREIQVKQGFIELEALAISPVELILHFDQDFVSEQIVNWEIVENAIDECIGWRGLGQLTHSILKENELIVFCEFIDIDKGINQVKLCLTDLKLNRIHVTNSQKN